MKILGIIVEYNPMHNGHIYQIQKAKELINPDYTIVIMSGNFTQQGNLSVLNKFSKASLAVQNGVDLVLELPVVYATSSAEFFAKGAVTILNSLNSITHLVFGSECYNIQTLTSIAKKLNTNENKIINLIKKSNNKSKNIASIRSEVLKDFLTEEEIECIDKPNNILAIEYLKNLDKLNSTIEPVLINRVYSSHNSLEIANNHASSTLIRKCLNEKNFTTISSLVPQNVFEELKNTNLDIYDKFFYILKYEIIRLGKEGLNNIQEVAEGIENRIYDMAINSNNYNEFIKKMETKRYTLGRIKRICSNIILGITKGKFKSLCNVQYAKILKVNGSSKGIISLLTKSSSIPILANLNDNDYINQAERSSLAIDILSSKIYNILSGNNVTDYTNKLD
ncbi:MAG: nucleotidyltransferase [Clostridia bacterium]|nr:nucleotidyltransferase [Clostridia bacterium]